MNPNLLRTQWHQLPEKIVRQLQAEKLRRYLRDVVLPFSPHYREIFRSLRLSADDIRSVDDLRRLPFTSKSDLLPTSEKPARYLALGFGSKRYPIVLERRIGSEGRRSDVSIKDGGAQVEYADQDPRLHGIWLEEIRKTGVRSQMGKYIDESVYSQSAAE